VLIHRAVAVGTGLAAAGTVHSAVNLRHFRRPRRTLSGALAGSRISVLVPARDEAAHIVECLAALRHQVVAEILVLDDASTDGTGALARASGDPRVRVLDGAPLPAGWLGKPWACAQLAAAAAPASDVLVFLDADVRLAPGGIAAAAEVLLEAELDLITPQPRQVAVTPAERLVQPLLAWSFLTTLPLRLAEHSSVPALGAANGQFLLVRRDAYERAGGHGAVRADVLDDLALLRAVKLAGGHGGMVDGSTIATCRMYSGWDEVRQGYGKSLWAAFGRPAGAAGAVGVLGLAYVLPPLAALRGSKVGLAGYLAAVAGRLITANATGGRALPDAFAHPASIATFGYLTGRSAILRRRGRLTWKGRSV